MKRYGAFVAVDDVGFDVAPGEIHALIGENGAGKSTTAAIAAGTLRPDAGTVTASGTVGLVHQHFALIERLTVWENIVLGREPRRAGRIDRNAAIARVRALSERHGLAVDPLAVVETLPVAVKQRVELLRELAREPAVLVLDEPTAALAPIEIDAFFAALHALAANGTAMLVITHKLREVIAHTQRVTVMRRGTVVARRDTAETNADELARDMVGGDLPTITARTQSVARGARLRAEHLAAATGAGALVDADFHVDAGEIVGVAGIEGNGQTPLADALAGVIPYTGSLALDDVPLPAGISPAERIARGLRIIPQDRQREALVGAWSIADNVALGSQATRFAKSGRYDRAGARLAASAIAEAYDVRASSLDVHVGALSGGNQQKIVVGRALSGTPLAVVAYQPTRGIDVGAAALVQSRLIEARNAGAGVLLISFELDEVLALADRVIVLFGGRVVGTFAGAAIERGKLGALMAGAV